jgi:hypothetical protein
MNGLLAKRLRALAYNIVLAEGKESPGKDYNQYNQESNCVSWEPAYKDGYRHDFSTEFNDQHQSIADINNAAHERATDPDGKNLLGMFNNPGTVHHKHKVTLIYKHLKKLWKKTGGNHDIFGKRFRRVVRTYAAASKAS